MEAYRPGTEGRGATRKQTVLDLDGATVDTWPFGGQGDRRLSPMRDFLTAWGLPRSKEKDLVRRITATCRRTSIATSPGAAPTTGSP